MQDTLSDMLVRIKNAQMIGHESVPIMDSKLNRRVCELLADEGYVQSFEAVSESGIPLLSVQLKYYLGKPVISNIKRVSKSSKRVYLKSKKIPKIIDGFGVLVVSTSQGLMSHIKAKLNNIGGEALFWVN